jgi:hypothetical protein
MSGVNSQALQAADLERLAARPENRVMRWGSSGAAREEAFTAEQLSGILESLKRAVVEAACSRSGQNELMVRWQLSRQRVPGVAGSYTWGAFAEHYPTFWGRLTSASATRKDVVTLHAMLDARRRFERGELASEQDVEAQIQNDLMALHMSTEEGAGGRQAAEPRGRGSGSSEMRAVLQQARLRRTFLERQFAGVMVPREEIARRGISYTPSLSCLHEIQDEYAELAAKLAKPTSGQSRLRKKYLAALHGQDVMFGRRLLQLRVAIAKRCLGLPEPLDPKGASFMPTYSRSAQADVAWVDEWVGVPAEIVLGGEGGEGTGSEGSS